MNSFLSKTLPSNPYSRIPDNYTSREQVIEALQKANLESSNLIIGIDFTKSNEWKGKQSFNGLSLHHIGETKNPYEQAISCIGNTLSDFDEDNKIPCFGFGDASTKDKDVFSFYPDGRACNGIAEVQARYRELVPDKKLSGPTSFAPIINKAVDIVTRSGSLYHVLLIIADGQVTSSDSENLSYQEECTKVAIQRASNFPLSIVLVGVGDGPWDLANNYDNFLHSRHFDNFQFVNFTEIMSMNMPDSSKESQFALQALMEIPLQYAAIQGLGILGTPPRRSIPQISSGSGFESVVETFDHPVLYDANQIMLNGFDRLLNLKNGDIDPYFGPICAMHSTVASLYNFAADSLVVRPATGIGLCRYLPAYKEAYTEYKATGSGEDLAGYPEQYFHSLACLALISANDRVFRYRDR